MLLPTLPMRSFSETWSHKRSSCCQWGVHVLLLLSHICGFRVSPPSCAIKVVYWLSSIGWVVLSLKSLAQLQKSSAAVAHKPIFLFICYLLFLLNNVPQSLCARTVTPVCFFENAIVPPSPIKLLSAS